MTGSKVSLHEALRDCSTYFFFSFFFFSFWRTHVHFWGHWYPCFGFMVTSPLGFKARVGIAEVNIMYVPQDPPLVLHIADLLTDSIVGHWPGSYLAQGYYCVAAMSLEPTINRSWVPRANHLATRPGLGFKRLGSTCLDDFDYAYLTQVPRSIPHEIPTWVFFLIFF